MEALEKVLEWLIQQMTVLFNACTSGDWGLFGYFIISMVLLRQLAKAFNKIKG